MKSRRDSRNGPRAATAVPNAIALEGERRRLGQGSGERAQMRTQSGSAGEKKSQFEKEGGARRAPKEGLKHRNNNRGTNLRTGKRTPLCEREWTKG